MRPKLKHDKESRRAFKTEQRVLKLYMSNIIRLNSRKAIDTQSPSVRVPETG